MDNVAGARVVVGVDVVVVVVVVVVIVFVKAFVVESKMT